MPAASDFVHLHVHTDYSHPDGACRIDKLMNRASELGMTSLALTDHGNLFGAIEFYKTAKDKGINPLIGCEIYLAKGSRLEKRGPDEEGKTYYHMGLLAKNADGYHNLLKLVSDAHLKGFYYKPRADMETLAKHANGLIGFSGCLAALIPQHLLNDRHDLARSATARFVDIFGRENFFIEIQDHGIPEQLKIIPSLLKLAEEFNLPVICTNDVHYINHADAGPHDALLCIKTGAKLADPERMRFACDQFYLKSRDEMLAKFHEVPNSLSNTLLVAEMCDLEIPFPKGSERYPRYPLPPELQDTPPADYLLHLCDLGFKNRYNLDRPEIARQPAVAERLAKLDAALAAAKKAVAANPHITMDKLAPDEKPQPPDYSGLSREQELVVRAAYELSIINLTGFVDYFLVVWDFIHWAKQHSIPVGPGRGSGAGSLVAFLLGITNIDPLVFGLLFERFLNPERVSAPDFDIDFCMRRRGEVIDYVREKYGRDCVANIITYGTLGAKMAIRDITRVNDHPLSEGDRLAKMIPDEINISLDDALAASPELRDAVAREPQTKKIFDTARAVEGLVRNTGKHAAGIIITDQPLDNYVPLTLQEGDVTVQFDMAAVGKLGLLKMDFLGLKTLTIIADAVENIRRSADPSFNIETIPLDDPATFRLLNAGKTVGVFQLESSGMQNAVRQIGINDLNDINAISALYRPGPMQFIPDYARGKKDPASIAYPHPLLEPILRETFGVIVYQEQVMQCAQIIAGYSLGGADVLRRAMGKKDENEMNRQRAIFVAGAKKNHAIQESKANEIFDLLHKFAQYGFNKSHSAAYALVSYQTAFLKANFPIQFMAAVLTAELGNADKVAHFIAETEAMGFTVLGPDINESAVNFAPASRQTASSSRQTASSKKIRFGLAGIKGVGESAARAILAERDARGPYADFTDFLIRFDARSVNKRVLENLAATGAFDFSGEPREKLFADVAPSVVALAELQRIYPGLRKDTAQKSAAEQNPTALLFDLGPASAPPPSKPVPPLPRLRKDFLTLLKKVKDDAAAAAEAAAKAEAEAALALDGLDLDDLDLDDDDNPPPPPPERVLTADNRLSFEKELLGFYISGHPLNAYDGLLDALNTCPPDRLLSLGDRAAFRLCGLVSGISKKLSKKEQRPWAAFKLSTKTASIELLMFSNTYESFGHNLKENAPVAILGNILPDKEGGYRANIRECHPLDSFVPPSIRKLTFLLRPDHPDLPGFLEDLRKLPDASPGYTALELAFLFEDANAALVAETSNALGWRFNTAVFQSLRKHPAVAQIRPTPAPLILKEDRPWLRKK
ncbi:MAG: DNA polymerase III subunit alpha [Opitutaceae bacterium]|jgi:DNA polymerase-3 subunit alpha|nr:DNA polymerase III subunit alpha [Opitutaceae bacterium]